MMGVAEGKKWPGTDAETKFAEYLVRTAGAYFVTVVRRGVGEMLGVRVPGQTFVVQELMAAASASTLESLQRENEFLRTALKKTKNRACGGTFVAGQSFEMIEQRVQFLEKDIRDIARTALASTGGEHHAE